MKKTLSFAIFGLAAILPAMGDGTASPLTLIQARTGLPGAPLQRARALRSADEEPERIIPAIIRVQNNAVLPDFANELGRRGDLVLAAVPASRLNEMLSTPGVLRMESGVCALPAMNLARGYCNLPQAQAELPTGLSGKGVVTGFADTGFDPNHINFLAADGSSRVRRLVNYSDYSPQPDRLTQPSEIAAWSTDNTGYWHATHVAGIMAGGYRDNGFYGVAPDADIVATTSPLYDAYLLAGAEEAIDYAREKGAPAPVFNMSIASSTGPHDGTTLFNQYLARVSEDAVVCISAGNDGRKWGAYFPWQFSADKPKAQAIVREYPLDNPSEVSGIVDVWSLDERPVNARLLIYDNQEGKIVHTFNTVDFAAGVTDVTLITQNLQGEIDGTPDEALSSFYEAAYAQFSCEVNPENGRFNVVMAFHWLSPADTHRYFMGIEIEAAEGARAEVYASSAINFMYLKNQYSPQATNERTINDLACGSGIAVVGATVSRGSVTETAGDVAQFTSSATLNDGRRLPSFCAPGAGVVSSVSTPYYSEEGRTPPTQWSEVSAHGRQNYWDTASGTSMSSPFAAGVFALWLEANPALTPAEVINIAQSTLTPAPGTDPRWGAGILDAYAGLKEALRSSSVTDPAAETASPIDLRRDGPDSFTLTAYTQPLLSVTVADLSGRTLLSYAPSAPDFTLSLSTLPAGVYLIHASTSDSSRTFKLQRP